jgi:phosphohistidine phosphatase
MELILWRHAEAEDAVGGDDLGRALTKRGRKQAERVGEWLKPRLSDKWLVLASPAKRAVQTAKGLDMDFEERPSLVPGASAKAMLAEAGWPGRDRPVVVVGHQPTLGEAAARLLGVEEGLAIRKAAIWWFVYRNDVAMLRAVIDAEMLER